MDGKWAAFLYRMISHPGLKFTVNYLMDWVDVDEK